MSSPGPDDSHRPDRLQRLDALAELLPTIAATLDIREVFNRVSEVTRRVLPHDAMGLALLDEDGVHARIYAVSSAVDFERPETVRIDDGERRLLGRADAFEVVEDISSDPVWRSRPPGQAGLRSLLRVPIAAGEGFTGGISFFARSAGAFSAADVPVARRVADYVALALSHQRLAEEAARTAEARERAQRLERRVDALTQELAALSSQEHRIVGRSPVWTAVIAEATRVARTETTVLLTGESGTGKELVARLIHRESARARGPLAAISCAALPEPLLESELFGAERGAYTGAVQSRAGRLEQAAGGTLFLDEVGEMSPAVQAKLLRVLQEREFQRLGGSRTLRADVRVICATNRDLRQLVAQGLFREDLFYRVNVFEVKLPPLRERADDILRLTAMFLEDAARQLGRPVSGLSADARPALLGYHWPGNVRELRNVIERAAILADGGLVTRAQLNLPEVLVSLGMATLVQPTPHSFGHSTESVRSGLSDQAPATLAGPAPAAVRDLATLEREAIEHALVACRYNKAAVARRLGLTRTQLYVRLRRHGLSWDRA
jgi:transcriptional regulator with GAF, ATPase, and Fis domain